MHQFPLDVTPLVISVKYTRDILCNIIGHVAMPNVPHGNFLLMCHKSYKKILEILGGKREKTLGTVFNKAS